MILTCTVECRPSQIRGGANITLGPISRMSWSAVSGSSGKLMVNPMASAVATDIICSPIQASGRKETNSSVGRRGSTWCRLIAMVRKFAPAPFHLLERDQLVVAVPAQPARVGIDDVRDLGELVDHAQDLVDLLLVLGDHELRVAVIDHVQHFGEARVLVDADGCRARGLGGQLRDHPLRAVVADDRDLPAPLEPESDQPERELAHPLAVASPAGLAPDAEVLLPQRRAVAEALRVLQQELGKGVARAHAAWPPRYAAWTSGLRWTSSGAPSAIFWPKFSTTTLCERSITTPMSCSIMSTVVPRSSLMSRMYLAMSSFSSAFMPAIGSSRSNRRGSSARARPNSTRFCRPYASVCTTRSEERRV